MSESLLFAILGFLIACLLGTVFASFLWRRAVTVTTRKITEDENFAAMDEVADLKADLRSARNGLATKDREISEAQVRIADAEAALSEAQSSSEGTTEQLKGELENAGKALETAQNERDAALAALSDKDSETKAALSAKDSEIENVRARVTLLENAIRSLAKETSLLDKEPDAGQIAAGAPAPSEEETVAAEPIEPQTAEKPEVADEQPGEPDHASSGEATSEDEKQEETRKPAPEPALAVNRSLEERIEALKQGEGSSA